MKEFTKEEIEAMKHFPRTLPEDRQAWLKRFLPAPSYEDALAAREKQRALKAQQKLTPPPYEEVLKVRKQKETRARGSQELKKIMNDPQLTAHFMAHISR